MRIDDKFISDLEDLSCLTLTDSEKSRLTEDLRNILNCVARISELNIEEIPAASDDCDYPLDCVNVFRDDEVHPSLNRELILKNAPVKTDEFFVAPKTVE
jgi:aspartyl-tRNA(Asn)/glutamyl-tRNA(Gln) amidotransferase subunit C